MSTHNDKIADLRGELFSMLRTLRDPNQKIDIERFRLGNDIAQTIINSARVEVDFIRTVGPKLSHGSGFIEAEPVTPSKPAAVASDAPAGAEDGSAADA